MGKHSKPTLVRLVGDTTTYLQVNDWEEFNSGNAFFSLDAGEAARILSDAACLKIELDVFVLDASEPHWHVGAVQESWDGSYAICLHPHSRWIAERLFSDEYVLNEILK